MCSKMDKYLTYFFILFTLTKTVLSEADLTDLNTSHDHLDPLNDHELENLQKDQDKRTVFSPTIHNYGWAKHVAVHPSGGKAVIGYGAVDLKYLPVLRPISFKHHSNHHHHHHRVHIKQPILLRPVVPIRKPIIHHHQEGWRPAVPIIKPVVPVNVPPPQHHVHHLHHGWEKPVQQPIHVVKPAPIHQHIHVAPVPALKPLPFPVVPQQILPQTVVPQHVIPQPVVPQHVIPQPVVPQPSPVLFQVTKPNLPVLPLGATFPSPVLQHVPTAQFKPALPSFVPQHVSGPAFVQPAVSAPGTVFEYHGTHNFIPYNGQLPVPLPQQHHHLIPASAPVPIPAPAPQLYPQHFHPHVHDATNNVVPQVPYTPHEQHDVQTPNHPNFIQNQLPEIFQEQQQDHQNDQQFNVYQQTQEPHNVFRQEIPSNQPTTTTLFSEQFPVDGGSNRQPHSFFNQQPQHNVIQPGQTDLQVPLHLPQHPTYLVGNTGNDAQSLNNEVFRPSVSLEPPFHKKK